MTSEDITVYEGRPSDDRSDAETRCYDVLDALAIHYLRADHPHADTIDDCGEIGRALGYPVCKNLFLTNRRCTDYYLLLMDGDKPFKTKYLSAQLGCSRLSFAGQEPMEKYLGLAPGSVSVLGLINDTENRVRLVIDKSVMGGEFICCHPCKNTSTLKLRTEDVTDKLLPRTGHDFTVVDLPDTTE